MNQKYLHKWGLIILVSFLNMVAPFSTDMYMPALPIMAEEFAVSPSVVDATLYSFTICSGIGILVLTPVSDKYGRKKVLLVSTILYLLGSLFCIAAPNIEIMIIVRILQAIGGGGMSAVAVAIVKDSFDGKTRGVVLSVVQSLFVIAPIIAPIIGGWMLTFTSWRAVFVIQVIIAIVMLLMTLLYQESIPKEEIYKGKLLSTYKNIFIVGKNKNFMIFLAIGSLYLAPFFAYLAVGSFIYQGNFGLDAQQFSLFFAINALFSLIGPLLCIALNNKGHKKLIQSTYLGVGLLCAIATLIIGNISPVCFLLCIIPFNITTSFQRPFATNILLEQHDGDSGSASALLNFGFIIMGGLGMIVGSAPWGNFVFGFGIITLVCVSISIILWIVILRSKNIHLKGM